MGYKSVLRSINSASNAAARESERNRKRLQREQERVQKKITKLEEKKAKISDSLKDLFAKGKIDKTEYTKLLKRDEDITFDILVFGKTAAASAAKRYICGKIDKKEFKALCEDIIPIEVIEEKQEIKDKYEKHIEKIKEFIKTCEERDNACHKCDKKKGIFSPITDFEGVKLCGKCKRRLKELLSPKKLSGTYFYVESHTILLNEIDKPQLEVNIQQNCF